MTIASRVAGRKAKRSRARGASARRTAGKVRLQRAAARTGQASPAKLYEKKTPPAIASQGSAARIHPDVPAPDVPVSMLRRPTATARTKKASASSLKAPWAK
jgi:hypothetical protein